MSIKDSFKVCKLFSDPLTREPLILIHQMGKVGSQTIEATLRNANLPHKIFRPHILSPQNVKRFGSWQSLKNLSASGKESLSRQLEETVKLYHIFQARKFLRFFNNKIPKINLIVGVREPVGLMLASIFQNQDAYFSSLVAATPENCRDLFLLHPKVMEDRRRCRTELMDYLNDWFDLELNGVAGIDVYAQPFPHQRGWAVYENRFTRALIYRLEDMQCIQAVLEEFLGVKLPKLLNRNIGSEKAYAEAYARVKAELRLPRSFLEQEYGRRLAQHFYTDAERECFIRRWCGKTGYPL